jgi:protein-tyrosine phosphatase
VGKYEPVIDLHCHILPGLDDGAIDLADSLAMARRAAADGITAICATPHIRHDHAVMIDELPARVERLNRQLDEAGVACRVLGGGEVAETEAQRLDERELELVSLGSAGAWILLEPAPGPLGASIHDTVAWLAGRGYRSVIAHPERHPAADMRERLADLARGGALIQATAAMFLDAGAAPTMLELAELGLVHLLASDGHSSRYGRPVALAEAIDRLAGVSRVRDHIDWIAREGPAAIVSGRAVEPPFGPRP